MLEISFVDRSSGLAEIRWSITDKLEKKCWREKER